MAALEGTVCAEVEVLISVWAVRLGFNQEGIVRDWLLFVRLVKWEWVSQAEGPA